MVKNEVTKFLKVRDVKSPVRAFPNDAGIDFFVPEFDADFVKDLKEKNPKLFLDNRYSAKVHNDVCVTGSGTSISGTNLTISGGVSDAPSVVYELNDEVEGYHFKFDEENGKLYFLLAPHSRVLIPAGIHSRMAQPGRALIAANKSGVANKHGLIFGAQVIDYSYQGEIHISVINTSTKVVRIYEDMKLIQFVETPVITNPIEITVLGEMYTSQFYEGMIVDRKAGGFGSTDK